MGRAYRCKCRVTGEEGTTDKFFKVKKGSRNLYYKSEEVYNQYVHDQKERKRFLSIMARNILGYKSEMMLSPAFLSRVKSLHEVYPYEVMTETAIQHEDTLMYYAGLAGKFNSEKHKQLYLIAIIQDKAVDVYMDMQAKANREEKFAQDPLVDIDLINSTEDKQNEYHKKNNIDISDFL